jgi:CHAT domain-containing protein
MQPGKRTTRHPRRLYAIPLIALCVFLLFAAFRGPSPAVSAFESQANTGASIQIAPGSATRGEITAGGKQIIEIPMDQGKLLRFSIEKGDLVMSTVLYAPSGARLLEHISQDLEFVEISFPAEVAGSYRVELQSREQGNERRPFELRVETATPLDPANLKDSEARQFIAAAEVLRATWTAAELRQARQKYDQAAVLFNSISDFSTASLTMLKAADVCFVLSEFEEAIKRYQSVAALAEKKANRFAQGRALSQLARVYSQMGDNNLAQKLVATAVDLLKPTERDSTLTRVAYGEALMNLAEISYSRGNYPRAKERVEEALRFVDQDRKALARAHRFIGYITGTLGDPQRAYLETMEALNLSRAINDKAGEGLALVSIGIFCWSTGKHDAAVDSQRNAIEIFHNLGDRHSEAIAYMGLGQAYHESNRSFALENYETALRRFESTGALDSVAVVTFKLATMYVYDNPAKALAYLDRCLVLSRAAGKRRNEANALSEITIVYASQNRSAEAAKQHARAMKFYEAISDKRGQATALNTYGFFLLSKMRRAPEALDAFTQALPLSESVEDKALLTTTLYNLALAHQALGNLSISLSFIERALRIIEDLRASVGSPELRAWFFSGVRQHYDLCRDILMQLDRLQPTAGYAKRAFLMSERSRARSLLDMVNESPADLRRGATAELLRSEREVSGLIASLIRHQYDLSTEEQADPNELGEIRNKLTQLNAQYQEIQAKLRAQRPTQSQLMDFQLNDVSQVQNALSGDTILLEYGLGEERSYLWVITSNSFDSYQLPGRKTLEDATREVYEHIILPQKFAAGSVADDRLDIEAADRLYREKAAGLSQMLLSPIAERLGNKRLVFVTEGALQLVPWDALLVPGTAVGPGEPKKFLIETNEVAALPSISTLLAIRGLRNRAYESAKLVAIVADPVISRSDERVENEGPSPVIVHTAGSSTVPPDAGVLRGAHAVRLIHASEEADAIAAVAPVGTTMTAKGFAATREAALSPRMGEYQILHFATHGIYDTEHPERTAMVLTMVDQNGDQINGMMSLQDIYNMDLSAQLTVLSACQTALGRDIRGEGLVGLTHSFMSAGSRSVVASLWKVDDRATAELMADFYQAMLREGLAPVAALRAAKLKMMRERNLRAPFYWAGFVFQGDYETRINVDSRLRVKSILIVVSVVLISAGLIVFVGRRRRLFPARRS